MPVAVAAASCGAELSYLSCEAITWNVSTGIRFPYLLLEERQARPPASAAPTPQNPLAGGCGQGGGLYGASPTCPFPCACCGHRGKGLGSRHGRECGSAWELPPQALQSEWCKSIPAHPAQRTEAGVKSLLWHIQSPSTQTPLDQARDPGRTGLGALAVGKGAEIDLMEGAWGSQSPIASWQNQ